VVLSLSPTSVLTASGQFKLTVTGENFNSSSLVLWNGAVRATTPVSPTELQAIILAADVENEATVPVTVASNGALAPPQPFQIISGKPIATITGALLTPASGGAHTLTLTGTDFLTTSTIKWNSATLTPIYLSPWQLTVLVPAADTLPAKITVVNPSGTSPAFELQ
jgi:hypothetical protein